MGPRVLPHALRHYTLWAKIILTNFKLGSFNPDHQTAIPIKLSGYTVYRPRWVMSGGIFFSNPLADFNLLVYHFCSSFSSLLLPSPPYSSLLLPTPYSLLPSLWVATSQYSTYFPGGGGTFLQCRGGEVSVSLFLPLALVSISLSLVFRVGCLSVTLFSEGATEA